MFELPVTCTSLATYSETVLKNLALGSMGYHLTNVLDLIK